MFDSRKSKIGHVRFSKSKIGHVRFSKIENRPCSIFQIENRPCPKTGTRRQALVKQALVKQALVKQALVNQLKLPGRGRVYYHGFKDTTIASATNFDNDI